MFLYKTVNKPAEVEIVIEKSRFIARVMPIDSYEDGQSFVAKTKQEYKSATHNVPAIVFGPKQEMQWASDDGEPSGTSGMPMLKQIADLGITNVAVVVTRYFGGIKLGTGGLSRAYSSLAKAGIEAAGICSINECVSLSYDISYSNLPKIQNAIKTGVFEIADVKYTDSVMIELHCITENEEETRSIVSNLTLGQSAPVLRQEFLKKMF